MYHSFYLEIRTLLMFSDIMLLLSNGSLRPLHDMLKEYTCQVVMLLDKLLCNKKLNFNLSKKIDHIIHTSLQFLLANLFH